MKEFLKLEPVFKQMVWGGSRLRDYFGYDIPGDDTGEAWTVSAHPQGDCRISGGRFAGKTLSWLWEQERGLFGNLPGKEFPLLVKYIDAKDDLSIQVHPDDAYASVHENGARGKTECWYILDCDENADIIVGHHAQSTQELENFIHDNRWNDLLQVRPIHAGDFFQIMPGTVHAIRKGTFLIEIQQNSAVTYRLYDYGRCPGGKPRELHLKQAVDVIPCPYEDAVVKPRLYHEAGFDRTAFVTCQFYTVDKYDIHDSLELEQEYPFLIVSVIEGNGEIDGSNVQKGDNLILPCGYGTAVMKGRMSLITAHV